MNHRQFRLITGLAGLLLATSINGLLSDGGWIGSACAQDGESPDEDAFDEDAFDEDADDEDADESSAEEAYESADESLAEDDSGIDLESEPVDEMPAAEENAAVESTDEVESASDEAAPFPNRLQGNTEASQQDKYPRVALGRPATPQDHEIPKRDK